MASVDDLNVFMMCAELSDEALRELPEGFVVRSMRSDELDVWKRFPFDSPDDVVAYDQFMTDFFAAAYSRSPDTFIASTLFACDPAGTPIATCGLWRAYGEFTTVQWLKTLNEYEGRGIGRALLSVVLQGLKPSEFPVYLHTQAGSYRAIKLYSDFGFKIIENDVPGLRPNQYLAAMEHFRRMMLPTEFDRLQTTHAPTHFEDVLEKAQVIEF